MNFIFALQDGVIYKMNVKKTITVNSQLVQLREESPKKTSGFRFVTNDPLYNYRD